MIYGDEDRDRYGDRYRWIWTIPFIKSYLILIIMFYTFETKKRKKETKSKGEEGGRWV